MIRFERTFDAGTSSSRLFPPEAVLRWAKNFSGLLKEAVTDTFSVSFPLDLDARVKATLLTGVFLIDFMHFENNELNRDNQLLH